MTLASIKQREDQAPLNERRLADYALRTDKTLGERQSAPPNYRSENFALVALAEQVAERPSGVLQKLAGLVNDLCRAGSSGISILETDTLGNSIMRWVAVAGAFAPYRGETMLRDASPCGAAIDADVGLLFQQPEREFSAAARFNPPIREIILSPFHVGGRPVGSVWAVSHDQTRLFDTEDMRILASLASFVSLRIFAPHVRSFAPRPSAPSSFEAIASLTSRQRDILERILEGQPNKIIAADLGISQRTAEAHRAAIMKKMGASSLSALVRCALDVR